MEPQWGGREEGEGGRQDDAASEELTCPERCKDKKNRNDEERGKVEVANS